MITKLWCRIGELVMFCSSDLVQMKMTLLTSQKNYALRKTGQAYQVKEKEEL